MLNSIKGYGRTRTKMQRSAQKSRSLQNLSAALFIQDFLLRVVYQPRGCISLDPLIKSTCGIFANSMI